MLEPLATPGEIRDQIDERKRLIEGDRVLQLNKAIQKEWKRRTAERLDLAIDTVRAVVVAGASATGRTTILIGKRRLYRESLWKTRRKHSKPEIPEITVTYKEILRPFTLLRAIFNGVLSKGERYVAGLKKYLSSLRHSFVMGHPGELSVETRRYCQPFRGFMKCLTREWTPQDLL